MPPHRLFANAVSTYVVRVATGYWGLVDRKAIVGKAFIIYWSWNWGADWLRLVRWERFANLLR